MTHSIDSKELKKLLSIGEPVTPLDVRRRTDYEANTQKIEGAAWRDFKRLAPLNDPMSVLPPFFWLERSPHVAQAQASQGFSRFSCSLIEATFFIKLLTISPDEKTFFRCWIRRSLEHQPIVYPNKKSHIGTT